MRVNELILNFLATMGDSAMIPTFNGSFPVGQGNSRGLKSRIRPIQLTVPVEPMTYQLGPLFAEYFTGSPNPPVINIPLGSSLANAGNNVIFHGQIDFALNADLNTSVTVESIYRKLTTPISSNITKQVILTPVPGMSTNVGISDAICTHANFAMDQPGFATFSGWILYAVTNNGFF